jgi:uncharacterized membrane-anchored protein
MKLAPLRRRQAALPGIVGVARLDRRTTRLAGRLNRGDIAIIDHVDLDRVSAEALVAARPAVVINAQPSVSGRYPNLGPEVIVSAGIPLVDAVGPDIFGAVKEGTRIRVDGGEIWVGEEILASGVPQSIDSIVEAMIAAKDGMATQLEAYAANTAQFLNRERDLLLEGVGIPDVRTQIRGRHVVVVLRGYDSVKDLKGLKHYIREFKPLLIGVDGGADVLLDAGLKPHVIVGDIEAVSDAALTSGAEVVVRASPDGRAPGVLRVQDLAVDPVLFPSTATSEDLALLLADGHGAELIVTVGTSTTLEQFLDRGRTGMASSVLTRLRIGGKLVDAKGVQRLHRSRITVLALITLVIAALVAVVAVLAASSTGHDYLANVVHAVKHGYTYVKELFS